jgi:hypothetical protein
MVATHVPVIDMFNVLSAVNPEILTASEYMFWALRVLMRLTPSTEVSLNNEPTLVDLKYAFEAVIVVVPVTAEDVKVVAVRFSTKKGPSVGA